MKLILWIIVTLFMSYLLTILFSSAVSILNILIFLGVSVLTFDIFAEKKSFH